MKSYERLYILITGIAGLIAALAVGTGEFLLHYDSLARFSETNYDFMLAASDERQTLGHFISVLGAPLYLIGCWHIYLMLRPAHRLTALIGFLIAAYGFFIGSVWISSRASIGAIIHLDPSGETLGHLITLYQERYESLLTVIRISTFILSIIFIALVLTGKTYYQKWQAIFSPILLLIANFLIYFIAPSLGKFVMPIALNVGFGLFFIMSITQAYFLKET